MKSGEFGIPSPILSGNYRNKFQQQIEIANDLIIEEVSDVTNTGDYIFNQCFKRIKEYRLS